MTLSFCYSMKYFRKNHRQRFSLILDFTCATAKDELKKHPEMRTIAMVELENNFPSEFSAKVLKCLPGDVAKIILNPHNHYDANNTLVLPKQTLVIYIADKVEQDDSFIKDFYYYTKNFPVVHHLSKHLIVSSDETKINKTIWIFTKILNDAQIYEMNGKIIAKSFDMTRNLTNFKTFETSERENLSQILFPDKTKNLNGKELFVVWDADVDRVFYSKKIDRLNNKWIPYLDIIAEKLNATLKITEIKPNTTSWAALRESQKGSMNKLIGQGKLDFYLNYPFQKFDLESYNNIEWCLLAPMLEPYSITELILFLPMDKSCWMWLGITITVSTLVWRISESHWNFAFGAFSYFMGQAQLIIRIRTNRLTMKILLQLWILAIFIFSNGYQSIVTSFMLNPVEENLLKSIDEVLDIDLKLKITKVWIIELLYADNPKYQKAKQDGRVVDFGRYNNWIVKMIELNLAYVQPCKLMKMRIDTFGDGKEWKGIYLVPEVAYSIPDDLYTRPLHPYIDKFQELMDRSLEAGLHQAWERFYWEIWREVRGEKRKLEEENVLLDFGLIAPFFLILAVGFSAALVALWCEIFHRDFVSELTREYFERKKEEIFGNKRKVQRRKVQTNKPNVRMIQVKPAQRRNSL